MKERSLVQNRKHSSKGSDRFAQIFFIVGSLVLYLALSRWAAPAGPVTEGGKILREGYGGNEKQYQILVEGLEGEALESAVTVTVGPRQYDDAEADAVFEEAMTQMEERIRAGNPSLMEVHENLVLPKRIEEMGIRLKWYSSDPELLNASGVLRSQVNEPQEVVLHVQLSDGIHRADYELPVRVVPRERTGKERLLESFAQVIQKEDRMQQKQEHLVLPSEYEGRTLRYRTEQDRGYAVLPLLGILLAVIWPARHQSEIRKQERKREQELLLDYAELVSKLMIFTGAGMNVRNAWGRMVTDYETALQQGRTKRRIAYEEMQQTHYQIQNGMSESNAYREFGRRCRLQPYLKLSSLLEQNRRSGTKDLRAILEMELADAFEMRKNLARRMGEEAGTKLLLPLFLMLGIIMVMIMVPAMMTMG